MLTVITGLLLVACGGQEESTTANADSNENVIVENEKDNTVIKEKAETEEEVKPVAQADVTNQLDALVGYFESNGYTIGEKTVKAYEMVEAVDGFGIEVNGENVEFYLYKPDSEALKGIQSTGSYDMDGFVIPSLANGNIVMMAHDRHGEKDKIVETFNSYKY